jgi:hydrogenase expression/formation protein HypD
VFLGVGFETTAPTIAAAIFSADQMKVDNFSVISAHKLVPPALEALMASENVMIDGFILPGHVSVIIGEKAYLPFYSHHQIPCVIAGFEPTDILQAIGMLVEQIENGAPRLENAYTRAVTYEGNTKAQEMLDRVFEPADACWRAIGVIPQSGLKIRQKYQRHDAGKGCACGEILIGTKTPPECPLYKTVCTPIDPVGPCMVSTEGTCAAYYKYHV